MKKLLSAILSLCLIFNLVIMPADISAAAVSYKDTTLGGYYKFTFGEDEIYNYSFNQTATYKNNQFMPVHSQYGKNGEIGYKQVTDSKTGEKYDTLQITSGNSLNFTPLTKNGQPYELTPGNEYKVKINLFNPVSNCWTHAFLCVGQENPTWSGFIEIEDGVFNYSNYPFNESPSFSNQGGMAWHYAIKDGTYGKASTFTDYNGGACLHTLDKSYGVTCSHPKRTGISPYLQSERTISLAPERFEFDSENMSYSAKETVYTLSGSEYVETDTILEVNNYLTLYLGGGNVSTYAKGNYPLYGNFGYSDLFDGDGNPKNTFTVWQIESIEIWETVIPRANLYFDDESISVTGEIGQAIDLNYLSSKSGKYAVGWYTDKALTKPLSSAPVFSAEEHINLYAKTGSHPDKVTYNLQSANPPTLKPYSYFSNGEVKSVTLNETGWSHKEYSKDGLILGKTETRNAYKWDPNKASSGTHNQTSSLNDYVALTTNAAVGERINGGWSAYSNYVLRDENGNPVIAKENTSYAIAVTYKKLSQGIQTLAVGIGRRENMVSTGANDNSVGAYNRFYAPSSEITNVEITDEYETLTFYVNTKEFSEGDVPVISLHNCASGYVVERVASVNGIRSYVYNKDGQTYYPYKVISYARIAVKDVQIIEIDSGNVAVTYNYYNDGEGFSAVLSDSKPNTPLSDSTHSVDKSWYDSKDGFGIRYTAYPKQNVILYNANYYMSKHVGTGTKSPVFGDGITLSATTVTDNGKEKHALKYTAKKQVKVDSGQVFRLGTVADGHTYRLTAKIKATALNSDLTLVLATASASNALEGINVTASYTVSKNSLTLGDWSTVNYYFTVDPRGKVIGDIEYGYDYMLTKDNNNLFIYFTQEKAEQNTLYATDFLLTDLGNVIETGGSSVLSDSASASIGGKQAIRFFFSYKTTNNGKNIVIDGESFTVRERGFVYAKGKLYKDQTEKADFFANSPGSLIQKKKVGFDFCWSLENDTATFSTYVKDFTGRQDDRKLLIKAYLLIEDNEGNRHYIHSDSMNRTVEGSITGHDRQRQLIWNDEFNVDSIKDITTFTQKHDTMSSSDSSLTLSTSEENYFIDPDTGEMVLRITSDGNKNYTTAKSVTTKELMAFRYGYLEIRAKVPYQKCVWPSFWMQPDKSAWNKTDYTGEIDIFEVMGSTTKATANLHKWYGGGSCTSGSGQTHYLDGLNNPTYTFKTSAEATQYHTYGFEWTETYMAFSVDGVVYCKIDITDETGDYCKDYHPGMDCFHNYYYVCFNNWLFTDQHSWTSASSRVENNPDFGTVDYRIDYIRLYQNRYEDIYIYE
ncbi:MAG: glycoside hydrolase family 16 protein [Clostridia bacterium]|nr:glycoside hydrolase family 16 protein [Clostridia bacterium]